MSGFGEAEEEEERRSRRLNLKRINNTISNGKHKIQDPLRRDGFT